MASADKIDLATTEAVEHIKHASLDRGNALLDDAHFAALEDNPEKATTEAVEHNKHASLDRGNALLDDAHFAALEDNPEKAGRISWSTLLSVFVSALV
jgi:hypothetical protein